MTKRKSSSSRKLEAVATPEADPSFPEYQALMTDLGDLLDPSHVESEVAINEEGQLMTWLADLAQMGISQTEEGTPMGEFMAVGELGSDAKMDADDLPSGKEGKKKKKKRRASSITPEESVAEAEEAPIELSVETVIEPVAAVEVQSEPTEPVQDDNISFDAYMAELEVPTGDLDAAIAASEMPAKKDEEEVKAEAETESVRPIEAILEPVAFPEMNESALNQPQTAQVEPAAMLKTHAAPTLPAPGAPSAASVVIRHHFDATSLFEGRLRLREVMELPRVPMAIFLGRAANRSLEMLPGVKSINLAELREESLETVCRLNAGDSFHMVLQNIDRPHELDTADLTVGDLSELDVDEVTLPLPGRQLLLARIAPDPAREGRLRGTLVLVGEPRLRAGATFLKSVASRLESPITLMV